MVFWFFLKMQIFTHNCCLPGRQNVPGRERLDGKAGTEKKHEKERQGLWSGF